MRAFLTPLGFLLLFFASLVLIYFTPQQILNYKFHRIVHAKRRNQAEPPPMQIPQVDLPETSSTAPLPTFSFTASLTSSSSTTASTPTFSFVTDSSKKEDLNKVPTFSFPPVSLPTFSFAPIANLSDKKDKDGEGKLNEKEDKSPSPNKEESQEKKPEVSGTPEKKSFSWPTFPTTFNPITSVDGVPGATAQSPWPSHDFGKIFAGTSASSTPTTFKFDPNTALLTSPPFNFAAFVQDALSKKDNEEESGSGEGEGDATGVAEKQGVFGKDVKGLICLMYILALPLTVTFRACWNIRRSPSCPSERSPADIGKETCRDWRRRRNDGLLSAWKALCF